MLGGTGTQADHLGTTRVHHAASAPVYPSDVVRNITRGRTGGFQGPENGILRGRQAITGGPAMRRSRRGARMHSHGVCPWTRSRPCTGPWHPRAVGGRAGRGSRCAEASAGPWSCAPASSPAASWIGAATATESRATPTRRGGARRRDAGWRRSSTSRRCSVRSGSVVDPRPRRRSGRRGRPRRGTRSSPLQFQHDDPAGVTRAIQCRGFPRPDEAC